LRSVHARSFGIAKRGILMALYQKMLCEALGNARAGGISAPPQEYAMRCWRNI